MNYVIPDNPTNQKDNQMNKIVNIFGGIVFSIFIIIFAGLLFALPVYLLWNSCLVDAVSGIHRIGWFQAWGLNILFGVLFNKSISRKTEA